VELAKREGVELRQSYLRVAKRAAIMVGRYTHAHQFKRARHLSLRDSEDDFAIRAYSNTISRFERRAVPAQGTGAD
jgi:hypothetical protein